MKIIKFTNQSAAEDLEKDFFNEYKNSLKGSGRKFKKSGKRLINRHGNKDHSTETIMQLYFYDELNGHFVIHPDFFEKWPNELVELLVSIIPLEGEVADKIYPEEGA